MHIKTVLSYLLLFFCAVHAFSQKNDLLTEARNSYQLVKTSPEKAIQSANQIIKQSVKEENSTAELYGRLTQCVYFEKKYDFKNMLISAEMLEKKAEKVNSSAFQAIARNYLFKAYAYNNILDKAFKELEEALDIINKADAKDSLVIDVKSNLYISMSNYYSLRKDPKTQLKYIRLSMEEHEKFSDVKNRQRLQYIDLSNLAAVYNEMNIDSAEYYAKNSMINDKGYHLGDIQFSNLIVLGQ